jgi:hypothetical protein
MHVQGDDWADDEDARARRRNQRAHLDPEYEEVDMDAELKRRLKRSLKEGQGSPRRNALAARQARNVLDEDALVRRQTEKDAFHLALASKVRCYYRKCPL